MTAPDPDLRARVRAATPTPPPLDVGRLAGRVRRRSARRRRATVVAALALLVPVVASFLVLPRGEPEIDVASPPPAPAFILLTSEPVASAPEVRPDGPDRAHLPTRLPAGLVRCQASPSEEPDAVTPLAGDLREALWCVDGQPALRLLTGPHAALPEDKATQTVGVGRRLGYLETTATVRRITVSDSDSMDDVHLRLEGAASTPREVLVAILGSVPALR